MSGIQAILGSGLYEMKRTQRGLISALVKGPLSVISWRAIIRTLSIESTNTLTYGEPDQAYPVETVELHNVVRKRGDNSFLGHIDESTSTDPNSLSNILRLSSSLTKILR